MSDATKLTSATVRSGMMVRFAPPEWAIMWEVAEGTGAGSGRSADAVMMSLWPSRGLELHGVEIKVSRSDWKREAKDPRKAEAIGKFCDRWWIHTTPGVVDDLSDVPPLWGLREYDGKRWTTRREAGLNHNALTPTRSFLAAMLRRADVDMRKEAEALARDTIQRATDDIESRVTKRVDYEVKRRTQEHEALAKQVAAFEGAAGFKIADGWRSDGGETGKAVALVKAIGLTSLYGGVDQLRRGARTLLASIDGLMPVGDDGGL